MTASKSTTESEQDCEIRKQKGSCTDCFQPQTGQDEWQWMRTTSAMIECLLTTCAWQHPCRHHRCRQCAHNRRASWRPGQPLQSCPQSPGTHCSKGLAHAHDTAWQSASHTIYHFTCSHSDKNYAHCLAVIIDDCQVQCCRRPLNTTRVVLSCCHNTAEP